MEQASCRGLNNDTFFPNDNGQGVEYSAVYRTCYDCPVKMQCRVAGIGERDGIWGGASISERRLYRRIITPIVPGIGGFQWDEPMNEWTQAVLERNNNGTDLTEALMDAGLTRSEVDALYAPTVGDRFALRSISKQENIRTKARRFSDA